MEDAIDLSLRSIQGIGWRSDRSDEYASSLSGIKAYVSFSGSVPNMKVSSFAMCFETGNLLIESNTPTVVDAENERKFLEVTFADKSSNCSTTSDSSGYQPHLQFPLRDNSVGKTSEEKSKRFLKFHVSFRSSDDGVIVEGMANLYFPDSNFEGLPLILDLPIVEIAKANAVRTPAKVVYFDESACIRVHLQDSTKQEFPPENSAVNESAISNKVEKIHEQEGTGMQNFHDFPTKNIFFGPGYKGPQRSRLWAFECGGATIDLKSSVKSFWHGVRGFRTKCTDDEDPELLTSPTMVSTILTRESLEI